MANSIFKKRPDTFDYETSRVCKCCGTMFQGRFCNRCGQKVTEPHERSILNFLDSLLNAFTFLDGKFIKSLKLLLSKPGQLSRNIADGVQTPFMKMVSLFFVANFFYFLFPVYDSFNSSLHTQMNLVSHREVATRMVDEKIAAQKTTIEKFTEKYNAQSTNLSKILLVILVIMFTFLLMAVNFSRKVYFFDHLLFSLEFYSFLILISLVIIPNMLVLVIKGGLLYGYNWRFILADQIYYPMMLIVLGYFLFKAEINFYSQKWYWALPKTIILLYTMSFTWTAYRRLLFYVTMWTL